MTRICWQHWPSHGPRSRRFPAPSLAQLWAKFRVRFWANRQKMHRRQANECPKYDLFYKKMNSINKTTAFCWKLNRRTSIPSRRKQVRQHVSPLFIFGLTSSVPLCWLVGISWSGRSAMLRSVAASWTLFFDWLLVGFGSQLRRPESQKSSPRCSESTIFQKIVFAIGMDF